MKTLEVPIIPCSNFSCDEVKRQPNMLHIKGGFFCSAACWVSQLRMGSTRVEKIPATRAKESHALFFKVNDLRPKIIAFKTVAL